MKSYFGRVLLMAGGGIFVFVAVAAILLRLMAGPHKQADYLVIGTLSTFATMATLFIVLLTTGGKDPTVFTKRKKE